MLLRKLEKEKVCRKTNKMREFEFDPSSAVCLFQLVSEVRELWGDRESLEGFSGILNFELINEFHMDALEAFCHYHSCDKHSFIFDDYTAGPDFLQDMFPSYLEGMDLIEKGLINLDVRHSNVYK
jgi:hypothetical protein